MSQKWKDATDQILQSLDISSVYQELGIEPIGDANSDGWVQCRSADRPDNNPSAGFNISTGRYKDFGNGLNLSLFDFAHHVGKFTDWKEARREYAKRAGVKLPSGRESKQARDKLDFVEWVEILVWSWCEKKRGITPEAVKLAGGRLARWPSTKKYKVLAFPIYGVDGLDDDPIGYTLYSLNGQPLPDAKGDGRKMLLAGGSKKGWIGQWGLSKIRECNWVLKVEGTTDLLAAMSICTDPDVAIISNSHGSTENPQDDLCAILTGKTVAVLHDGDTAGEIGAKKWAGCIAGHAAEARHARLILPDEIKDSGGDDLRDWVIAGGTWSELSRICFEQSEIVKPPEIKKAANEVDPDSLGDELILKEVGLEVLGEKDGGKVKVFSQFHRKSDWIPDVSKLTFYRLLQIGGPKIKAKVHNSSEEIPDMWSLSDVKDAISVVAGFTRLDDEPELGRGIWRGKDLRGRETENLILVGSGEAAIRNGEEILSRVTAPRYAGRILDISNSHPWFDFEDLAFDFERANPNWMADSIEKLEEIIARWSWIDQGQCPKVAVGLILATWIQTIWDWRPQIVVTGKSGCGKTTFFHLLDSIFGELSILSSSSTAAGIQQALKSTAEIALCDEFDSNKERERILELLRMAGRGDRALKGTPGLKSRQMILRHIVWAAGIDDGLRKEPDQNRFIGLPLVKPPAAGMGKLDLPDRFELANFGQRTLVVAIKIAFEAKALAIKLAKTKVPGADYRVIESFAVPAACYSVVFPEAGDPAGVLTRMLTIVQREIEEDEQQLLDTILGSTIRYKNKQSSVSAAIADMTTIEGLEAVEAAGVRHLDADDHAGVDWLFVHEDSVRRHLLRGTDWEKRSVAQILLRVPGAERCKARCSGRSIRGIKIPFSSIDSLSETKLNREVNEEEEDDGLF